MTKEQIIDLIDKRIKSEYIKHKDLNWSKIASHKIYISLVKLFDMTKLVGLSEQLSCGRNITTCVFYKECGKCSNLEYCKDQTT